MSKQPKKSKIEKHKPNCASNQSCAVYHEDGKCPGYKKCDCGLEFPNKKLNNCLECQFENGKHSQECSEYKENVWEDCMAISKQSLNNEKMSWEEELEQILEDNFPKLNKDNPEIASSNNRSAALVMYAHTKMLIQKLLLSERQKIIKEFSESKILLSEKEFEEILKNKKEHSELREKLVIQEVRKDVLREFLEWLETTKNSNSAFMNIKNDKNEIEDWMLPVSEIKESLEDKLKE